MVADDCLPAARTFSAASLNPWIALAEGLGVPVAARIFVEWAEATTRYRCFHAPRNGAAQLQLGGGAPNHRRRIPRITTQSKPKGLQGHGKRILKGKGRLLDRRRKPTSRYPLPDRERPPRPLRIRAQPNPERHNRLRILRWHNANPLEPDRSMETRPNPVRIWRRRSRRSERRGPRRTRSMVLAMPTRRRARLERSHSQ